MQIGKAILYDFTELNAYKELNSLSGDLCTQGILPIGEKFKCPSTESAYGDSVSLTIASGSALFYGGLKVSVPQTTLSVTDKGGVIYITYNALLQTAEIHIVNEFPTIEYIPIGIVTATASTSISLGKSIKISVEDVRCFASVRAINSSEHNTYMVKSTPDLKISCGTEWKALYSCNISGIYKKVLIRTAVYKNSYSAITLAEDGCSEAVPVILDVMQPGEGAYYSRPALIKIEKSGFKLTFWVKLTSVSGQVYNPLPNREFVLLED